MLLCVLILAVRCPPGLSAGAPESPKVLVLNSYHPGEAWSDNELAGILAVLRKANRYLVPPIEYLDLKRFHGPEQKKFVKEYLARKYKGRKTDVLIVLDNPAFELALKHRSEMFPGIPIVFAGVNDFRADMLKGHDNITGVAQKDDIEGTLRFALSLHPNTKRILVVRDYTSSGRAMEEETRAVASAFAGRVEIIYPPDESFPDLKRRIETLPADSFVLLLTYVTDAVGRVFSREESTRLIAEASRVPVYSIHEALLGFGIVGGYLIDGKEHGAQAAEMALRILSGEPASSIPVENSRSGGMFDHLALARFRIRDDALPVGSIIVNRPVSFYDRNRTLVLGVSAFLSLLLAAIVALSAAFVRTRRAEESLRISEERFRVLSEQSPLGMALIDHQGRYEYVNPAFVSIFGYTLQEVRTGRDWFRAAFPDPDVRGEVLRAWKEDLAGTGAGEARPRNFEVICKDGARKSILFRAVSLSMDRRFVIYEDVTRQGELQAQLQQAMKMEAVGRLAGGVAHDFNNLLTVIIGNVSLAFGQVQQSAPVAGLLSEVTKAAERAAGLTQQLLAFSRKQIIEPKVLNLNDLIADLNAMLVRLIREDIKIRIRPGKDIGAVKVDVGQFQQVVVNLVVNARDAMPEGGKIAIETSNVELDEGYCALHPYVKPGRFVMLSVSDTGHGMSKEVKALVFEPFFTTKAKGSGTGLGLATTYGVVKQAGGSVEVYSEVGMGTTFKIYLPRVEGEASTLVRDDQPQKLEGGSETVLLVEDEDIVRGVCVKVLGALGYKVLQASNGEEAIVLSKGHEGRIDLLMTDVVMPGMNGRELAAQLILRHQGMKVLFTSGYTEDVIVHHGVLDDAVSFLGKPYSPSALGMKIREVLDKSG